MKIRILLLTISLFLQTSLFAQEKGIDSIQVEKTLSKVFNAFKNDSYPEFNDLLFSITDRIEISRLIYGEPAINEDDLKEETKKRDVEVEKIFDKTIAKGRSKGIDWLKIQYENWVGNSKQIFLHDIEMPKGFLVNCHLKITYEERKFAIVGIQLWLIHNEYRINGYDLRGIFEVNLESFIAADDMYLDEMEQNGH